ncbi:MAG: hypothetical protein OEM24_01475 [Paracoccaceae bacterium]|nr:hypothetical protein [Paracoccaceae bacterium]
MRLVLWLTVWLRRLVILAILAVIGLGAPIAYTEYSCRAPAQAEGRAPPSTLDSTGRAYAALPGYVVARAHEDYAATLAGGDPHDFGFLPAVMGYWNAACAAVRGADAGGGFPTEAKLAIYSEGAGFTANFLAKAAYEETLGRVATMVRGETRAPLDDLSAEQAAAFASSADGPRGSAWDHAAAARDLIDQRGGSPRDWERMIALNIEYRARGAFRGLARLPELPQAPATLRAVVTGLGQDALLAIPSVSVLGPRSEGFQIETSAGAEAVPPLTAIASAGGTVTDVAGAGQVLLLVSAPSGEDLGALVLLPRPDGGSRQVLALPVAELGPALLRLADGPARVERLLGN